MKCIRQDKLFYIKGKEYMMREQARWRKKRRLVFVMKSDVGYSFFLFIIYQCQVGESGARYSVALHADQLHPKSRLHCQVAI